MRIYDDFWGWGTIEDEEKDYILVSFDDDPDYIHVIRVPVKDDEEEEE